jgi:hypothetical protein
MNKMKVLLATICCLFVMGSAKAEYGPTFTAVYQGQGTYPTPLVVKINIVTPNGWTNLRTFNGPGATATFANPIQSFSIAIYTASNMAWGPFVGPINWTYWNWTTNGLAFNSPYRTAWIGNINRTNYYLFTEKTSNGVNFRIGI